MLYENFVNLNFNADTSQISVLAKFTVFTIINACTADMLMNYNDLYAWQLLFKFYF